MANAIKPGVSKNITMEEAWVIIAEYWDLEGQVEMLKDGITRFSIFYKNTIIKQLGWSNDLVWVDKEGDWDFSTIYRDVLEWLIKSRTIKKSRAAKGNKTLDLPKDTKKCIARNEEAQAAKAQVEAAVDPATKVAMLKKQKQSAYNRMNNARKKGEDISKLEQEYKMICRQFRVANDALKKSRK